MTPFWKKKQDKQQDNIETSSEKAHGATKEEILDSLLSKESNTLNKMLKKNFEVIREKKEMPSLGHALDLVPKALLERLDSYSLRAYNSGYFHMYPLSLTGAGDLDKLGTMEFDAEGNVDFQNYAMPGEFLLAELSYPEKAKELYEHNQGRRSREEVIRAFSQPSMEPALKTVLPRVIIQATYKNLLYLTLEFETNKKAQEFMFGTEINWRLFFVTALRIKDFLPYVKKDNELLHLDLPMSIMPRNVQSFPLTETNRIWWSHEKTVFSASHAGKEIDSERFERKNRLTALISIYQANRRYLKVA